jgi:hypothetical protein
MTVFLFIKNKNNVHVWLNYSHLKLLQHNKWNTQIKK